MAVKKLDKKQIEGFKGELLKLKEKIIYDIKNMISINSADGSENGNDSSGGHGLHLADVATDMYDREFNLNLASNDRELLNKIDGALKRIEEKNFGVCSSSKKSIPSVRLKAIPYTETCLKCQEELEKNS